MTNKILASNNKYRHTFAATLPATSMDNLIEIQIRSFNEFIQKDTDPSKRDHSAGLQAVFNSVFPITDYNGRAELHFDSYELLDPQYDVDEYRERALTYHSQLKVKVRMDNYVEEFTNKLILRPPYSDEESEIDEGEALEAITTVLNCSAKEAKSILKDSKKEPCVLDERITQNREEMEAFFKSHESSKKKLESAGLNVDAIQDKSMVFKFAHFQDVYFGEFPLMTNYGTFIINGTERVIVSQLHRSPGVFFDYKQGKSASITKEVLSARIIPNRGSWIDFEFDARDNLQVRIDRRKKLLASTLLRGLGYSSIEIMNYFYDTEHYYCRENGDGDIKWYVKFPRDYLSILDLKRDIEIEYEGGEKELISIRKKKKISKKHLKKMEKKNFFTLESHTDIFGRENTLEYVELPVEISDMYTSQELIDSKNNNRPYKILVEDLLDPETGEVLSDAITGEPLVPTMTELTEEVVSRALEMGVKEFKIALIDGKFISPSLYRNLLDEERDFAEKLANNAVLASEIEEYAVLQIYERLRPNDPSTPEVAEAYIEKNLFEHGRYDLSRVGRTKINKRLYSRDEFRRSLDTKPDDNWPVHPAEKTCLTKEDVFLVVKHLNDLKSRRDDGKVDDIDHLGNRRIRSVGELLENHFRTGLVRMEKAIKEKMNMSEVSNLSPNEVINSKPVTAVIKEFFGSSQLSQFMDQTNPLSEVTHKRRLSALGPGGLTRERASGKVRDVHTTHYGRICPVETPEGPNVGLIASMASYARINPYGFIQTPYITIKEGQIQYEMDEDGNKVPQIDFYSAIEERNMVIIQAETPIDEDGKMVHDHVVARKDGELQTFSKNDVNLMDVSPNQMVSVAASLIPFLENDDANRALMGSNMQRQAVPLLKNQAPLVGTGMEKYIARDSGVTKTAKRSGIVTDVDANRIVVLSDNQANTELGGDVDIYRLTKYRRSNQNTCINQKPLVRIGERVEKGDIIADGPATDVGELALGKNPIVAFMPWQGYNFEDSILISENLVRDDTFTSIHIEEYEVSARDTKLGKEEITRDIPNAGESALRNLDTSGIIQIGAYVKPGDILVGKTTPKGDTQLSPEQKLLRAIFGEKAGEVKDTSLRARTGVEGVVIGAQVFTRDGTEKDERSINIEQEMCERIDKDCQQAKHILKESAKRKMISILAGHKSAASVMFNDEVLIKENSQFTKEKLAQLPFEEFESIQVKDDLSVEENLWDILDNYVAKEREKNKEFSEKKERLKKGDELLPGVIKRVVVYIAIKRKLQVGDKMAGRHGNKGVVSRVMAIENMPYLSDGTPVDVVLNPLGVPSRMNVGQILETHLGWAARGLGVKLNAMLDEHDEYLDVDSGSSDKIASEIRSLLLKIYDTDENLTSFFTDAGIEEMRTFIRKYRSGVTISTPVFSGVTEDKIKKYLRLADLDEDGRSVLYDGRTGEPFENRVTVGVMYILKLHHLVDEKIHARSIGPYSLVTQQPLGGKAQFGGQRLGEMEVWALEAYGAAYSLQEFLTVKSDDVTGRTKMYESIVRGDNTLKAGLPESFHVLIKELHALALDVNLLDSSDIMSDT